MQTKFDAETGKTAWIMDKWYQKTLYVLGWIYFVLFTLGFIIGFINAL